MTYPYLDTLPLNAEQKKAITEAEYENAPTLYMICKTIPTAMKEYLGLTSLDELEKAIWEQLSTDEREAIQKELDELDKM